MKKNWILGMSLCTALLLAACSDDKDEATPSQAEEVQTGALIITGDTVTEQGGCVLASRFSPGDKIVFRNNILDGVTNEQVIDAKVQVHLSTGEVLDMTYGQHGEDNFWVVAYPVTEDTPTGTLDYTVTASFGDKKAEYKPFNVAPSLLTIVSDEVVNASADASAEEPAVDTAKADINQNVDLVGVNFEIKGANGEKVFYVKQNEEVTLTLKNEEGMHGIAIEEFKVNLEQEGEVKFTPTKAGEFDIVCSIFCGAGHGDMKAKLVVVE